MKVHFTLLLCLFLIAIVVIALFGLIYLKAGWVGVVGAIIIVVSLYRIGKGHHALYSSKKE